MAPLRWLFGHTRRCPVCNCWIRRFKPLPVSYHEQLKQFDSIHDLFGFETLKVAEYECPRCGASDRDRLYALYLRREIDRSSRTTLKFIDFAPTRPLSSFIRNLRGVDYRSADLHTVWADDRVDVTDMPYADGSVDAFLCSHVLEHVLDDRRAVRELFRILKPGGWGILMVPIPVALRETLEDPSHASEAERWKYYGQGDHVRMYSREGFVSLLSEAGFQVQTRGVQFFGSSEYRLHAIDPRSTLYVARKECLSAGTMKA